MTEFLLFTLYAPLASWGDIAVGEERGSWDRPSRSAILGLLAAALGITRDQQADHDAVDAGYGLAVRLDASGASMIDYHTAQTAAEPEIRKAFGKQRPTTRRALLSVGERQTILSRRELREDALATACLWARDGAQWPLTVLKQRLERPVFTLCAGRKANVFGLPLAPTIVDAASFKDALATRPPLLAGEAFQAFDKLRPKPGWGREVAYTLQRGEEALAGGIMHARTEIRRDASPQRTRWQFAERAVTIGLLPREAAP
jgi:CRISPR system Cascade subunit CasD